MKRSQARKWDPRAQPDVSEREARLGHSRFSLALRTLFWRKRKRISTAPLRALSEEPPSLPEEKPTAREPESAPEPILPMVLAALASKEPAPEPLRTDLVQWAEETAEPPSSRFPEAMGSALSLHFEAPQPLKDRLVEWAIETAPTKPISVVEHFAVQPQKRSEALVRARQTPVPEDPFAALWSKILGRGILLFARGKRLAHALLGRLRTKQRNKPR